MIAYVKGEIAFVHELSVVVDVGGVGYLVNVSPATIARLPGTGAAVQLFTYFQSGESGQSLHGFLTREEVRLFTLLISVSGIGPKVASSILGAMSPQQIILSIVAEDAVALSKAPGVGKKTAQRVMLELKDKIGGIDSLDATGAGGAGGMTDAAGATSATGAAGASAKQDAISALLALGYGKAESVQAVLEVADDEKPTAAIIKLALKKLAGTGAL
ncbi:MAG: Holliday junction branch migration protein RuvA [Defluviitaleaceae bacterium]|nr:Holliday junction branch migration protein RuvA [Defluviitaleaceae bacterium]